MQNHVILQWNVPLTLFILRIYNSIEQKHITLSSYLFKLKLYRNAKTFYSLLDVHKYLNGFKVLSVFFESIDTVFSSYSY